MVGAYGNGNIFQPQQGIVQQPAQPAVNNVFAAFVQGESALQTYLVPAGGAALLIDLADGKMWLKATDPNGVPCQIRTFEVKETTVQTAAPGVNAGVQEEVQRLNGQYQNLSQQVNQILETLKGLKGSDAK